MKALTASRGRERPMWKKLRPPVNNQHVNAMVWTWNILQRFSSWFGHQPMAQLVVLYSQSSLKMTATRQIPPMTFLRDPEPDSSTKALIDSWTISMT